MHPPVNFLPWRQQRRNACLRMWGGLFGASAAIVLALTLIGYLARATSGQANGVLLQAEQQLATALTTVKPRLEARQRQAQQVIQRDRLREQTRRWQAAAKLAASIWNHTLPADAGHPYLQRKEVPAIGLRRTKDGRLIIPVLNHSGRIQEKSRRVHHIACTCSVAAKRPTPNVGPDRKPVQRNSLQFVRRTIGLTAETTQLVVHICDRCRLAAVQGRLFCQ